MIAAAATPVLERLAELAQIGRHETGISRPLATPQERDARALIARWSAQSGFALSQDRVGNLFARKAGTAAAAAPILVGSHLDTVATGGAYDGAYGVVGALCALELLTRAGIPTRHSIEAVAWAGEEGSRFPMGCLGSSVFSGMTSVDEALALCDETGVSLADALSSPQGGLLDGVDLRAQNPAPAAYLELHIEQGPVLDDAGVSLGIVSAIAAQRRYRVTVAGRSGHAGTVPMDRRSDALCAASELVLALEAAAKGAGEAVATVGRLLAEPNGTNVIPSRIVFSIDVRSADDRRIETIESAFANAVSRAERRGVTIEVVCLEKRAPARMDDRVRAAIRRAAGTVGSVPLDIASGAGHDAMCLARIAPAGMIFVPSVGGESHVGTEHTADADLELGVRALALSIIEVDKTIDAL